MLRAFVSTTMFVVFILAAEAGDPPGADAREFAKDLEQLTGSWSGPQVEYAPGITGNLQLRLEFKKDTTVGQATVLSFVSKSGVVVSPGPTWTAELKEKDKKRFIVLSESKDDKRMALTEIAYELNGDKLKLTSSHPLSFEKGGKAIGLSGDWERWKAKKK